jgi:hypothetical protein
MSTLTHHRRGVHVIPRAGDPGLVACGGSRRREEVLASNWHRHRTKNDTIGLASPRKDVLTDDGTWAIIDGTGVYETVQGRGRVTGTADDHLDLISRTYSGTVRRG